MAILCAYCCVVLIWATTPLAIQWSGDSLSFIAAAALRMMIASALALPFFFVLRGSFLNFWENRSIYFAASIGIFPNMPVVYWASQFIPSGLMAVIFALSPFVTGLMTLLFLRQNPFSVRKVFALLLALSGLVVIFYHQLKLDFRSVYGISGIFLSCILFSFSSVWVKRIAAKKAVDVNAFHQATGALLFSLPGLLLCWYFLDGETPQQLSVRSGGAVIYLAVVGSLVGSALFFFVLKHLSAGVVSLITLMTPVISILLGRHLANESLSIHTLTGVALVLVALLFYSGVSSKALLKWWGAKLRFALQNPSKHGPVCQADVIEQHLQQAKDDMLRYK